jgi:hypothetical protein
MILTETCMGYREQEHANAPAWYFMKFPPELAQAIKVQATIKGQTITEYLVESLEGVPGRVLADDTALAPEIAYDWRDCPPWIVKHFPEELRQRLRDVADGVAECPLYELVTREMAQVTGWKP